MVKTLKRQNRIDKAGFGSRFDRDGLESCLRQAKPRNLPIFIEVIENKRMDFWAWNQD